MRDNYRVHKVNATDGKGDVMKTQLRIRGRRRAVLDESQLALAFLEAPWMISTFVVSGGVAG
jgi:hypothetical protein